MSITKYITSEQKQLRYEITDLNTLMWASYRKYHAAQDRKIKQRRYAKYQYYSMLRSYKIGQLKEQGVTFNRKYTLYIKKPLSVA